MIRYSYIRFVGGPWHNRVVCVELLPVLAVPEESPVLVSCVGSGYAPRPETKQHQYLLRTFKSWEEDADGFPELVFQQYIHQSLCPDPPAWVTEEVGFPPLPPTCFARFLSLLSKTSVGRIAIDAIIAGECDGVERKRAD